MVKRSNSASLRETRVTKQPTSLDLKAMLCKVASMLQRVGVTEAGVVVGSDVEASGQRKVKVMATTKGKVKMVKRNSADHQEGDPTMVMVTSHQIIITVDAVVQER